MSTMAVMMSTVGHDRRGESLSWEDIFCQNLSTSFVLNTPPSPRSTSHHISHMYDDMLPRYYIHTYTHILIFIQDPPHHIGGI